MLLLTGLLLLGLFLLELFVGFAPLGALLLMLPGCTLSTSLEHLEILVLIVGGVGPRGSHPVVFLFAAPWSHAILLLLLAWSEVGATCECGLLFFQLSVLFGEKMMVETILRDSLITSSQNSNNYYAI